MTVKELIKILGDSVAEETDIFIALDEDLNGDCWHMKHLGEVTFGEHAFNRSKKSIVLWPKLARSKDCGDV